MNARHAAALAAMVGALVPPAIVLSYCIPPHRMISNWVYVIWPSAIGPRLLDYMPDAAAFWIVVGTVVVINAMLYGVVALICGLMWTIHRSPN